MQFRRSRGAIVGAATIALVASPFVAAAEPLSDVDRLAAHIAEVAPFQGEVVVPRESGQGKKKGHSKQAEAAFVQANGVLPEVEVPLDPDEPITIDASVADADFNLPQFEVNLPTEAEVADGEVASDGTVIYEATDGGADGAVQILDDGSVRLQAVIPDAGAQHEFTYTFGDGIVPVETEGGVIELVEEFDGGAISYGQVDQAWAVDVNGHDIETSYRIEGDTLVQVVQAGGDAAYPVVADPRVTTGIGYTNVYFNRSETLTISYGGSGAAGILALVPKVGPVLAAVSGALAAYAGWAHSRGSCLRVGVYGVFPAATWAPTHYSGGYCR